jgi:hypothetical protein
MSRWLDTKTGKRTTRPAAEEEVLIAATIITDIQDDPDGSEPIQDATVRDESISTGQSIFQPYVDIQHSWRAGTIDIIYGFTVSGAGELTIDDTTNGTGRLVV